MSGPTAERLADLRAFRAGQQAAADAAEAVAYGASTLSDAVYWLELSVRHTEHAQWAAQELAEVLA